MYGTDREMQGGNRVEKKAEKRESIRVKVDQCACLKWINMIEFTNQVEVNNSYILINCDN